MATSQRLSRGFNRLGLFLAAIPLLIGGIALIFGGVVVWKTPTPHISTVKWTLINSPSSVAGFRQRYPQYDDLSDDQLLEALYRKFYSDMPREQFDAKVREVPSPPAGYLLDETLQVEGVGKVKVAATFDRLSLAEQNKTVDEIVTALWWDRLAMPSATLLGITLAVSLAIYGIVRAIGWVIGGFAAS